MREIVLSALILALAATMVTGICTKADIMGAWESQSSVIEFYPAGKCRIDNRNALYRLAGENRVKIYQNGKSYDYFYMISFDDETMQFGEKSYLRISQSGVERSMMALFE